MNSITKELIIHSDPATVWAKSFSTPAALSSWFPQRIEGDFVVGGSVYFVWGEHRSQCRITEVRPESALAYQWHPGDAFDLTSHPESELTTVRFTLEPHPEGTLVRVEESGFDNIPETRRAWALEQNTGGWEEEMAKLPLGYTQ